MAGVPSLSRALCFESRLLLFFFSSASPARSLLLSGGAAARRGSGRVAWHVHSSYRCSFSLCASFACRALSESRSADLGGQIRRAVAFFLLAAVRRWQAVLHVMSMEARISPNKVRTGSFELGPSGQPWPRAVLLPLVAALWRLELTARRRYGGFHMAESLALCFILFNLPPLASGLSSEYGGLMHHLRQWEARFCGISGDEKLLLLCRCGCGKKRGRVESEAPRGDLSTATCGDHQRRRVCASVFHGRRGHSVLWRFLRHRVFNLQAGVLFRRPSFSSAAASIIAPSPSGLVPGDGRCAELLVLGGEGSDCIPIFLVWTMARICCRWMVRMIRNRKTRKAGSDSPEKKRIGIQSPSFSIRSNNVVVRSLTAHGHA